MRWRVVIALGVLAAVVSPAVRDRDSMPLSTYPMYATARPDVVVLATAVGIDDRGAARRLSLDTIARSDDPLITESRVDEAIRSGGAGALCREIAGRVGDDIAAVEVVEERHDLERYAAGDPSLVRRHVHATCEAVG
jgi:hypothetical protein